MVLLVMTTAKPAHFPRLLIVVVVSVNWLRSTDLAWLSLKQPAPQGGSNILVCQEFQRVGVVPFYLR